MQFSFVCVVFGWLIDTLVTLACDSEGDAKGDWRRRGDTDGKGGVTEPGGAYGGDVYRCSRTWPLTFKPRYQFQWT